MLEHTENTLNITSQVTYQQNSAFKYVGSSCFKFNNGIVYVAYCTLFRFTAQTNTNMNILYPLKPSIFQQAFCQVHVYNTSQTLVNLDKCGNIQ